MEGFAVVWVFFFVILTICITIAPLIIWRNTNRTNRLLALMLLYQGVPKKDVIDAYEASGSSVGGVPGSGVGFKELAKKTVDNFKLSAEDEKLEPVKPTSRYCHQCGTDAPLDADACPTCTRLFSRAPLFCPKCAHEISHKPESCPGCEAKYQYKEKAS